jgi:hypothetical protein
MGTNSWKACWIGVLAAVGTVLLAGPARSAQAVTVECSNAKAKIKTIAAGLAQIPTTGPSTLLVSGTCNENVTIQGYTYLTVKGNPTATINGGSDPGCLTSETEVCLDSVDILNSREVTLSNLEITGGFYGVVCGFESVCRLETVNIHNTLSGGYVGGISTKSRISESTIENNPDVGVQLSHNAGVVLQSTVVRGNGVGVGGWGVLLGAGANLLVASNPGVGLYSLIQNNGAGGGIAAAVNGNIDITAEATISGNEGPGVTIGGGSAARVTGATITGNGSGGTLTVSGNADTDVSCRPGYTATRGISVVTGGGGSTDCPAEP